jgi:hypothetical protein
LVIFNHAFGRLFKKQFGAIIIIIVVVVVAPLAQQTLALSTLAV